MFSKFVVALGIAFTITILFLDNFDKDSRGLLQLVVIDFFTVVIVYALTRKKPMVCKFTTLSIIVIVHILLLSNASGWNEGSMSGVSYVVPLFKDASDTLYALILFSAFLLLIPLVIYGFFIKSLVTLFCEKSNV